MDGIFQKKLAYDELIYKTMEDKRQTWRRKMYPILAIFIDLYQQGRTVGRKRLMSIVGGIFSKALSVGAWGRGGFR